MTTREQIFQATSICRMSCDQSYQLVAYYRNVNHRAEQVDTGLITLTEAIELVRK